jgi:multidrug resistance protein MdtO
VIGILFGNLVVALIFTSLWPVSVAGRIDPAIAALLRKLAGLAVEKSRPKLWALVAEAQTAVGVIEEDLALVDYEPFSIRPAPGWLDRRQAIVDAVGSLQGPLLIGAGQSEAAARRLNRLAENFVAQTDPHPASDGGLSSNARDATDPGGRHDPIYGFIETPLVKLERAIAQPFQDAAGVALNNANNGPAGHAVA